MLRTAVSGLKSGYEFEGNQIVQRACRVLQSYGSIRSKYERPTLIEISFIDPMFSNLPAALDHAGKLAVATQQGRLLEVKETMTR